MHNAKCTKEYFTVSLSACTCDMQRWNNWVHLVWICHLLKNIYRHYYNEYKMSKKYSNNGIQNKYEQQYINRIMKFKLNRSFLREDMVAVQCSKSAITVQCPPSLSPRGDVWQSSQAPVRLVCASFATYVVLRKCRLFWSVLESQVHSWDERAAQRPLEHCVPLPHSSHRPWPDRPSGRSCGV